MRVLHIIQRKQLRGAEMAACMIGEHFVKMGHIVRIVSLEDGDANMPFTPGVHALNVSLRNRFSDWRGWKRLAKEIREFRPDIVQANAGDTLKYAILSKLVFKWKAPLVFRNASMVSSYIKSSFVKAFNSFLINKASYIISVSEASRVDFLKLFPAAANKISVTPVGIEEKPIRFLTRQPGYAYIVHVGGFSFEKNHKGLLRIFKQVLSRIPNAILWLVGDGVLRPEIEVYCRELGLENNVVFEGYKANALDYIASADVLVLPSIIEGLPGVVLEAMYAETPVVAYDVGGVSEVIRNGESGALVTKDDEAAFVEACITSIKQGKKVPQVRQANEMVRARYLNERLANAFADTYEHLIRNK